MGVGDSRTRDVVPTPPSGSAQPASVDTGAALVPIATLLMVAAATSLPARLATRIPTADALRYE
jgi:hypothetical protein